MASGPVNDGLGTSIGFGTSTFVLDYVSITPPPIVGGDKIDLTTLSNTAWRTATAKTLKDVGELAFTARFDTGKYADAPVNVEQAITITFPDAETFVFQGYLRDFTPGESVEGERVDCSGVLVATNRNVSTGAETGPT